MIALARNAGLACAGYIAALQLIYPHFIAPFSAIHADMYIGPDLASSNYSFLDVLTWPRPVMWATLWIAGHFGIEATAAICTALTIASLVFGVTLIERSVLRARVPWWLAFTTFVYAMSAPSFYFVAGYDIASALALVFGMLGIAAWEYRSNASWAVGFMGVCFTLSLLAKESFAPAMLVYAAASAWRIRKMRSAVALLIVPCAAITIALIDSHGRTTPYLDTTYVHFGANPSDPYYIDISWNSILASLEFYLPPLVTPLNICLLLVCITLSAWNHRLRPALVVGAAALSLYLPYLILPNHRFGYYYWAPIPLLMLLIPIAGSPVGARTDGAETGRRRLVTGANAILAALTLATAWTFGIADTDRGAWALEQQNINRNLMAGMRRNAVPIDAARSVLVCGISFPFHPWAHTRAISRDLAFHGVWTVVTEPGNQAVGPRTGARPVSYSAIVWTNYDAIVIVEPDGNVSGVYRPKQLERLSAELDPNARTPADVVAHLRDPAFVQQHAELLQSLN